MLLFTPDLATSLVHYLQRLKAIPPNMELGSEAAFWPRRLRGTRPNGPCSVRNQPPEGAYCS